MLTFLVSSLWLVSSLTSLVSLSSASICLEGALHHGATTPDFIAQENSTASINCTLADGSLQQGWNASMLYFTLGNKRILDEKLTVIDNKTATLTLNNIRREEAGNYHCYIEPPATNTTLICMTLVEVGEPPGEIPKEDFKCVSYDYSNLTCQWKQGNFGITTNYYLEQIVGYPFFLPIACAIPLIQYKQVYGCTWTLTSEPRIRLSPKLSFRLVSSNALGQYMQYFYLSHYNIIKPGEVQNFRFTDNTSQSITLQWEPSHGTVHEADINRIINYQLHYYPIDEPGSVIVADLGNITKYTVTGLTPNIAYGFKLRSRVREGSDIADEFWSPFVNGTMITEQDIPYECPKLHQNAYEVIDSENPDERKIRIYWEPVNKKNGNAPGFHYVLTTTRMDKKFERDETTIRIPPENFTYESPSYLKSSSDYRFEIYASNSKGRSVQSSSMIVEKKSTFLSKKKPTEVYTRYYENKGYEVVWSVEEPAAAYTIAWCRVKEYGGVCRSPVLVKDVHPNETRKKYELTIQIHDKESTPRFAVSASENQHSTDLTWSECTDSIGGSKYLPRLEVIGYVSDDPKRVHITVRIPCKASEGFVEEVEVALQNAATKTTIRRIMPYSSSGKYSITNLDQGTDYNLTIRSLSQKASGPASRIFLVHTAPGRPRQLQNFKVVNLTEDIAELSWEAYVHERAVNPLMTVYLSDKTHVNVPMSSCKAEQRRDREAILLCRTTFHNLKGDFNYDVKASSCLQTHVNGTFDWVCSSNATTRFRTPIRAPGVVERPIVDYYNDTHFLIEWKEPVNKNGPLTMYRIRLRVNQTSPEVFDVPGNVTKLYQPIDMSECSELEQLVTIQAINVVDGKERAGDESEPKEYNGCFIKSSMKSASRAAVIAVACAFAISVCVIISLAKWMKKKIDAMKAVKIELPKGLQSGKEPNLGDPLPHKAKSFTSEVVLEKGDSVEIESLCKTRHHSGTSHGSHGTGCSTDGLLDTVEKKGAHFQRTYSDQSTPENGHESVSSNSTCATQVSSVDSGAVDDRNDIMSFTSQSSDSNGTCPSKAGKSRRSSGKERSDSGGSRDSGLDIYSNDSRRLREKNKKNRLRDKVTEKKPSGLSESSGIYGSEPSLCHMVHNESYGKPLGGKGLADLPKYAHSFANFLDHIPAENLVVANALIGGPKTDLNERKAGEDVGKMPDKFTLRDNYVSHDMIKMLPFGALKSNATTPTRAPPSHYVTLESTYPPRYVNNDVHQSFPQVQSKVQTTPEDAADVVDAECKPEDVILENLDIGDYLVESAIINQVMKPEEIATESSSSSPKLLNSDYKKVPIQSSGLLSSPYVNLNNDIELSSPQSWKSSSASSDSSSPPLNPLQNGLLAQKPPRAVAQEPFEKINVTSSDNNHHHHPEHTHPQQSRKDSCNPHLVNSPHPHSMFSNKSASKTDSSSVRPTPAGVVRANNGYVVLANGGASVLPNLSEAGLDSVV